MPNGKGELILFESLTSGPRSRQRRPQRLREIPAPPDDDLGETQPLRELLEFSSKHNGSVVRHPPRLGMHRNDTQHGVRTIGFQIDARNQFITE